MTTASVAEAPAVPMTAKRRGAQVVMLAFAIVVVMGAYASVGLGINGQIPSGTFTYGLGLAALMFAAYGVLARWAPGRIPCCFPW